MQKRKLSFDNSNECAIQKAKRINRGKIRSWSEEQVHLFLEKFDLAKPFEDVLMDGKALLRLDPTAVIELGVEYGPMLKFFDIREQLTEGLLEFDGKENSLGDKPKPFVAYVTENGWEIGKRLSDYWNLQDADPECVHLIQWQQTGQRRYQSPDGGRDHEVDVPKQYIIGEFASVYPLSIKNFEFCNKKANELFLEKSSCIAPLKRYTTYTYPLCQDDQPGTNDLTLNEAVVAMKCNNETYVYLPQFCRALGILQPTELRNASNGVVCLTKGGIEYWSKYVEFTPGEPPKAWRMCEIARYFERREIAVPKQIQHLFQQAKLQRLVQETKES